MTGRCSKAHLLLLESRKHPLGTTPRAIGADNLSVRGSERAGIAAVGSASWRRAWGGESV